MASPSADPQPERELLAAFLDQQRAAVAAKVAGLPEADARRRLVPSLTTPAGLLKHLAAVERGWFQRRLARRDEREIGGWSYGDDRSWQVGHDETVADLLREYDRACAQSREVAARLALDDAVPHPRLGKVSLRWVYLHMIEETARHAGHADILREQMEGTTGS